MSALRWASPLPQGNDLYDVATPDGRLFLAAGGAGTILRSTDGARTWTVIQTPTDRPLTALAGDRGLWVAVGHGGAVVASTDGGLTWTAQKSRTSEDLQGVYATGHNNLFAVGWHGTILRSTDGGAAWTTLPSPVTGTLYAVSGRGDDLWAVGEGGVILGATGDGATWHKATSGTTADLFALWIGSLGDILIAGDRGAVVRSTDHGATFVAGKAPTEEPLFDVWGTGADLMLCGLGGALLTSADGGATFASQPPLGAASLYGLAGAPVGPVVVVGGFGRILRAENHTEKLVDLSRGPRGLLTAVATDGAHVVVVGAGGTLMVDGAQLPLADPIPLAAVAIDADNRVAWAAGGDRLLRLRLGEAATPDLTSVSGVSLSGLAASGGKVVAVGAHGTVLVDGAPVASGTQADLAAVIRVGAGWLAVGQKGTIVKDGAAVASGVTQDLRGVFAGPKGALFVVGRAGTLLRSTDGGASWSRLATPTRQDLATGALTGDVVTLVGEGGVILELSGGDAPVLVPSPTWNALTGIAAGGGKMWIVGAGGTILSR